MSQIACSAVLVLALAIPAAAQDSLLPTDISGPGEVTVTGQFRFIAGQGTLTDSTFDVDFDQTQFVSEFRVGVGIGGGFEIEASFPYVLDSTLEADESGVEVEFETSGLGDLTLEGNYLVAPSSKASPQVMAGLVVVLPFGNDDFTEPEITTILGTSEGEEGGPGEGVVKFGLQVGVSKELTGAHVYGAARFLISTGTHEEDDLEIDRADVFTIVGGAMLPLGDTSKLDLRLTLNRVGDEIAEDDGGGESTEEAHINVTLEPRFYVTVGDTLTVILGGSLGWVQDHAFNEESELDLEETFVYGVTIGLHLRLGVPRVAD